MCTRIFGKIFKQNMFVYELIRHHLYLLKSSHCQQGETVNFVISKWICKFIESPKNKYFKQFLLTYEAYLNQPTLHNKYCNYLILAQYSVLQTGYYCNVSLSFRSKQDVFCYTFSVVSTISGYTLVKKVNLVYYSSSFIKVIQFITMYNNIFLFKCMNKNVLKFELSPISQTFPEFH